MIVYGTLHNARSDENFLSASLCERMLGDEDPQLSKVGDEEQVPQRKTPVAIATPAYDSFHLHSINFRLSPTEAGHEFT